MGVNDTKNESAVPTEPKKIYTLWHVYEGQYEFAASATTLAGLTKAMTNCIVRHKSMRFGNINLRCPDQVRLVRETMRNDPTVEAINRMLAYGMIEVQDAREGEETYKLAVLEDLGPLAMKCRSAVRKAVRANIEATRNT